MNIKITMPHDERGNDAADHIDDQNYARKIAALVTEAVRAEKPVNDEVAPPPYESLAITDEEMSAARITPTKVVDGYLYADVALLSAPGGVGKTTLQLYEMVMIALGRPLHGLEVVTPGWCLFVTAEDQREQLVARLREIMRAMELTADERATVLDRVRFWDVTGQQVRLCEVVGGNVMLTGLADSIVSAYKGHPPVLVVFDPLVSFGADEQQVNQNEQAIITAARRIVRGFDACVRLVSHTGKMVAREQVLDQYASRGGSALSDGARMVAVLQPWNSEGKNKRTPPPGCSEGPGVGITILARPKNSYAPPNRPNIWIRRTGYSFESYTELNRSPEERKRAEEEQVLNWIKHQRAQDLKPTKSFIEGAKDEMGMSRDRLREILERLITKGFVYEAELPREERQGNRKHYIEVAR